MKTTTCSLLFAFLLSCLGSGLIAQTDYTIGISYRFYEEAGQLSTPLRQSNYIGQFNHGWGLTLLTPSVLQKGPFHVQFMLDYSRNLLDRTELAGYVDRKEHYTDLHGGVRLMTKFPGNIQLFSQGQVGFQQLRTKRVFFDEPHVTPSGVSCPGERLSSTVDNSSATFSMAAGGGLRVLLKNHDAALEFGYTHLWGGRQLAEVATPSNSRYGTPAAQVASPDYFDQAPTSTTQATNRGPNTAYLRPQHFTVWISYVLPLDITE